MYYLKKCFAAPLYVLAEITAHGWVLFQKNISDKKMWSYEGYFLIILIIIYCSIALLPQLFEKILLFLFTY